MAGGYIVVMRCIDLYFGGSPIQSATYVEGSLGQAIYAKQWNSVNADWAGWRGRQVFYPGETCFAHSDHPIDITIMGYAFVSDYGGPIGIT